MKGADYIVCSVHLWFLSVLPLLSSATQLRAMLDARRDNEHASGIPPHVVKDGLILAVFAFSTAVCVFSMQCVKAVWPRGFRGECHNVISFIAANARIMLVGIMRHALPFIVSAVMWLAYDAYVVRMTV